MARKRTAVSVKTICKMGTVAYNRSFSPRDFSEYTGQPTSVLQSLVRRGIVRKVPGGHYYPTARGWKAIDRACNMAHGR